MEDDEDDEDFDAGESDDDGKDPAKPKRAPPIQLKGSAGGEGGGLHVEWEVDGNRKE